MATCNSRRSALAAAVCAAETVSFKRVVTLPRQQKPGHAALPLYSLLFASPETSPPPKPAGGDASLALDGSHDVGIYII